MEGGHPKIGAELARRNGETSPEVLHAILGHHDDVTIDHIYTVLVASADAHQRFAPGSAARNAGEVRQAPGGTGGGGVGLPGGRARLRDPGWREVRVIANASKTTDAEAIKVCHDIAKAIEEQLHYPGEIKVTVVRETRAVEYAR